MSSILFNADALAIFRPKTLLYSKFKSNKLQKIPDLLPPEFSSDFILKILEEKTSKKNFDEKIPKNKINFLAKNYEISTKNLTFSENCEKIINFYENFEFKNLEFFENEEILPINLKKVQEFLDRFSHKKILFENFLNLTEKINIFFPKIVFQEKIQIQNLEFFDENLNFSKNLEFSLIFEKKIYEKIKINFSQKKPKNNLIFPKIIFTEKIKFLNYFNFNSEFLYFNNSISYENFLIFEEFRKNEISIKIPKLKNPDFFTNFSEKIENLNFNFSIIFPKIANFAFLTEKYFFPEKINFVEKKKNLIKIKIDKNKSFSAEKAINFLKFLRSPPNFSSFFTVFYFSPRNEFKEFLNFEKDPKILQNIHFFDKNYKKNIQISEKFSENLNFYLPEILEFFNFENLIFSEKIRKFDNFNFNIFSDFSLASENYPILLPAISANFSEFNSIFMKKFDKKFLKNFVDSENFEKIKFKKIVFLIPIFPGKNEISFDKKFNYSKKIKLSEEFVGLANFLIKRNIRVEFLTEKFQINEFSVISSKTLNFENLEKIDKKIILVENSLNPENIRILRKMGNFLAFSTENLIEICEKIAFFENDKIAKIF